MNINNSGVNYRVWNFIDNEDIYLYDIDNIKIIIYKNDMEIYYDSLSKILNDKDFIKPENISISASIDSGDKSLEISIMSDDRLLDLGIFDVDFVEEIGYEIDYIEKINFYMPTISYTKTTSSLLYGLTDSNSIIPLIDITLEDRYEDYLKDELIDYKHFLDLSFMEGDKNKELREKIKAENLGKKREEKQKLPEKENIALEQSDIINKYLQTQKEGKNAIPTLCIDTYNGDYDIESFYDKLNGAYSEFAVRVVYRRNFDYSEIIDKLASIADTFTVVLDFDTLLDLEEIKNTINEFKKYSFKRIISLSTTFESSDLTISYNNSAEINSNVIKDNFSLINYFLLINTPNFEEIGYGDYCGFDRKSLERYISYAIPSARVVLLSLDSISKTVLLRRGWDNKDRTMIGGRFKFGWKFSMTKLLHDLHTGKADKEVGIRYLDSENIDVDGALKDQYPNNTTPANIKMMCMRHNIIAIKNQYL
ncbi:MAG: hypothetical protein GX282_08175 [Campylobacteraceae bacterium]|nr:hypothetical protein [Campylobacteraceae bacterium]